MEGTSGAAERVLLRGRAREAALNGRLRESEVSPGEPVDHPLEGHLRRRLLQPPAAAGLRQEVSELIGLG